METVDWQWCEDSAKCLAKLMLLGDSKKIVVPTVYEWIGLGLLERDDELTRGQRKVGDNHVQRITPSPRFRVQ